MAKIDSVYDFSEKGLVELKSWLEPWFRDRDAGRVTSTEVSGPTFSQEITALGATASLLAYWRLGEAAGPTFADTNPYLSACDQAQQASGAALTANVTGALPAAQDDGAVLFNGHGSTAGDYLKSASGGSGCGAKLDLHSSVDFTVACWINPTANAGSFNGGIAGTLSRGISSLAGWGLFCTWPTPTVSFYRGFDGGTQVAVTNTVAAAAWSFIVGTYSATTGAKLYINGTLVGSDATVFGTTAVNAGVYIGSSPTGAAAAQEHFLGSIDEVSVWGSTLAAADIMSLYLAGISSPGSTVGIRLAAGETFTVFNSSGNPIFRVDEDGDLHGLTGKALTFDL